MSTRPTPSVAERLAEFEGDSLVSAGRGSSGPASLQSLLAQVEAGFRKNHPQRRLSVKVASTLPTPDLTLAEFGRMIENLLENIEGIAGREVELRISLAPAEEGLRFTIEALAEEGAATVPPGVRRGAGTRFGMTIPAV